MKIIGLEEHVVLPDLLAAWARLPGAPQIPELGYGDEPMAKRLRDVAELRIADMDAQGIDMQVLSLTNPGVQNLPPAEAIALSRYANDALAEIVKSRPDRFEAFASIPTPAPEAAAAELERAVTKLDLRGAMLYGRTGDILPDARQFYDLYATAERLRVPLYFHPQTPAKSVLEAYYGGYERSVSFAFATHGLGWYYDLGVQLLRLIFSGVFDRYPNLQVIVGHWGELVLFFLDHIGSMQSHGLKLMRPLAEYFKQNIWITGSGTVSERYMRWTAEVVGVDRMMYSTDYPYTFDTGYHFVETSNMGGRTFLQQSPFTDKQKAAIGSGNWERLTAARAR